MERTEISTEQFDELVGRIFPILAEKGPAHTTMDLLARRLSMSKRTLYEIFGSKDEMIKTVMSHLHLKYAREVQEIYRRSENMMEVMVHVLLYHQQVMSRLSANFFRDMDVRSKHLRDDYESNSRRWGEYISAAIAKGVKEGVFRADANYKVIVPLIRVQMESLRRIEEFFPPDITLVEAYSAIALGLLRSIATAEGMRTLDRFSDRFEIRSNIGEADKNDITDTNNINDNVTKE